MNLEQLIAETRKYLDDDSAFRVQDDEITLYINNSYLHYYNDLCNRNYKRFLKQIDIPIVDGYAAIPNDFYLASILYLIQDNSLIPLDYYVNYDNPESINNSENMAYTFQGNMFKLYGKKDGTLRLIYYPEIAPLVLFNDTPGAAFLSSWQMMIPVHAAIQLKGGREEEDIQGLSLVLGKLEQSYNDYLTRMTNARSYIHPFIP